MRNKLLAETPLTDLSMVMFEVSFDTVHSVSLLLDSKRVVRATKTSFGGKPPSARNRTVNVLLTVGAPNYREREVLRRLKRDKVQLPHMHLQRYAAKRKRK